MSDREVVSDEQEFLEAYIANLGNDLRTVEKSVAVKEIELDKVLEEYLKAKRALGLVYFLRDRIKRKIEDEYETLQRFREVKNE